MRFAKYNRFTNVLAACCLLANGGCAQTTSIIMRETVLSGSEYSHRITLPASFVAPKGGTFHVTGSSYGYVMHRYGKNPVSPNTLIVTAQPVLLEDVSPTAFEVDANAGYRVRRSKTGQSNSLFLLDDGENWRIRSTLGVRYAADGIIVGGKTYPTRTQASNCSAGASKDRRIVVIRCAVDDLYQIEVFDGIIQEHLASLNLSHPPDKIGWSTRYIQFLDNRWLAITLDEGLREILLFDFEPHFRRMGSK